MGLDRIPLHPYQLVDALAEALVCERLSEPSALERLDGLFGRRHVWMPPLVRRVIQQFGVDARPLAADLRRFLLRDRWTRRWLRRWLRLDPPQLAGFLDQRPRYQPAPTFPRAGLPPIATSGAIASWLGLTPTELSWFAFPFRDQGIESSRHYRGQWVRKASGDARLIEAPKPRLKSIQRQLLDELLATIPLHPAAHGFCRGRSVASYVAPHVGRHVVLRLDLCDFFPSIRFGRVLGLFLAAGYPEVAARHLARLCVTVTPRNVLDAYPGLSDPSHATRRLYARLHLPQGAPTSPALANLCAYGLDRRLAGLAEAAGATYTRYADDLLFSGDRDFARRVVSFYPHAAAIATEEGFAVRFRKTRVMRRSRRQHAAGVVLNVRPNVRRDEYDRLRAILHQCALHGPASQNRDAHPEYRAHLQGRVEHVGRMNERRGEKLRRLFARINWTAAAPHPR